MDTQILPRNRADDHLLETFLKLQAQPDLFLPLDSITTSTLHDVWEKQNAVASQVGEGIKVVSYIFDPFHISGGVIGQFRSRHEPIQVKDGVVDRVVYTAMHELGHMFDKVDLDFDKDHAAAEITAELTAWVLLRDKIPTLDRISPQYLKNMRTERIEYNFPHAMRVAERLGKALSNPKAALAYYQEGL